MWDLILSEQQAMILDEVRAFVGRELPLERLRPNAPAHEVAQVLGSIAELGWLGLGLPEEAGGAGLGLIEEVLVQRECGRHLASPSILASVLAAHLAHTAADSALAEALVAGKTSPALAVAQAAEQETTPARLYALDWRPGDPLLLFGEQGMELLAPEALADAHADQSLDDSVTLTSGVLSRRRSLCRVEAQKAPLFLRAQLLLAARLTGLAEQACEMTVAYAKVREQFGKPIGSFQAVKHRCADMAVRAHLAWQHTALASLKVEAAAPDARLQAAAAELNAVCAAHENGRAAIQLHGGIGFQSECDVHWLVKRAHVYDQLGGGVRMLARRVIAEPSPLW